jgi:hypothetical protein
MKALTAEQVAALVAMWTERRDNYHAWMEGCFEKGDGTGAAINRARVGAIACVLSDMREAMGGGAMNNEDPNGGRP